MFDALEKETGTAAAVKAEPDTNDEIQQFLNPNTSSSESSEYDSEKSRPPTPLPVHEPEMEPQIRKEKKLPRAVRRRVDRYIKKKLAESMNGTHTDEQTYIDPYASTSYPQSSYTYHPPVQYL